jgi:hypothetical protein
VLALLLAAAALQPKSPQAFVTNLYAKYRDANFSPFNHMDTIFAPRLAAAIRLDRRLAENEVGTLDWDPICGCQDWTNLRPEIRHPTMVSTSRAAVAIKLYDMNRFHSLGLILTHGKAGWRVADVIDHGSLLALLERENSKALRSRHN